MNKRILRDWLPRFAVLAVAVTLWEYFLSRSQNFLLPSFSHIATGLFHLIFFEPRFWEALYISNQALVLG
ncbi:MAG TPA: ABC transporter permease, partial [Candidatus Binatia bacterium]